MDYAYNSEISHTKAKAGDTEKWVASLRPLLDTNKSTSMSHRELIMMDTAVLDIEMKKASVAKSELEVSVFLFLSFFAFHSVISFFFPLFILSYYFSISFRLMAGREHRTLYPRLLYSDHTSTFKASSSILFWWWLILDLESRSLLP